MALRLFATLERTDLDPAARSEGQYAYLNRSARPELAQIRALLDDWFTRYPESGRPAFVSAFQSSRDVQFLASFYELYLHELLIRLGYSVEVHPENPTGLQSRPDFRAVSSTDASSSIYLEAVLVTDLSEDQRAAEARMDVLYDTINRRLGDTDFYLGMDISGSPETPIPGRKLCASLLEWLRGLDVDAISAAVRASGSNSFPTHIYSHGRLRIEFSAIPKSPHLRRRSGTRPIGIQAFDCRVVSTWSSIRDAIIRKANKYGELESPLVVAANVVPFMTQIDTAEVMQALFGQLRYHVLPDSDEAVADSRAPDGAWHAGQPRYTRVSAALISPNVDPSSVARRTCKLYLNPFAEKACNGPILSLPVSRPIDFEMIDRNGEEPRDILGLPESWPDV